MLSESIVGMASWVLPLLLWLFGVGRVLFVVPIGISVGLALALDSRIRNIRLAHRFFGFACVWAAGGVIEVVGDMKLPLKISIPLVFVGVGLIGVLLLLSFQWVERNHQESGESKATQSALPPLSPPPVQPSTPGSVVKLTSDQFNALLAQLSKLPHPPSATSRARSDNPLNSDLRYVFYGKDRLFYVYRNPSRYSASKPSISFGLMDLTNPYSYSISPGAPPTAQAFPIPARVFSEDYVRPGDSQGNQEILANFMGHIKNGDVIWGIAWVSCINCVARRAYYVYWKVGTGGWYAESNPKKLELPKPVMTPFSDEKINEYIEKIVPLDKRTQMKETYND